MVAASLNVPAAGFMETLRSMVVPHDVYGGMLKAVVFGLIISIVSCRQGLATRGGAVGVGNATTNAVVLSMVLVYISNYFLAAWLFTGNSG